MSGSVSNKERECRVCELEHEVFMGLLEDGDIGAVSKAWRKLNDSVHGFYFGVRNVNKEGGVEYCSIEEGLVNVANGLKEGDIKTWNKCLSAISRNCGSHSFYDLNSLRGLNEGAGSVSHEADAGKDGSLSGRDRMSNMDNADSYFK